MSSDLHVVKLSENIGARVDGVRLGELDAETAAAINQTLAQHKVLFFRGQDHLDDESHFAFAESLGVPTTPHPTLKFEGSRVMRLESAEGGGANQWHTDVTFVDRVPKASSGRVVGGVDSQNRCPSVTFVSLSIPGRAQNGVGARALRKQSRGQHGMNRPGESGDMPGRFRK